MHGKEARAWSDAIVALIPEDGRAEMSFVGRYHDHLRRENGRWLLVKHIAVKTGDPSLMMNDYRRLSHGETADVNR
ncbi:snoaL-like domain protein [Mycobacterium xenopi 4042]|uniref:SnoaL-like domain protein n=1 Tax=Mycobacterium xenopi 4042 TaxID=1299334 RepID=X8AFF9_MYCXE|nr:snoaL-like domain protein [Mycobacterium xenopi 4042]